MHCFTGICPEKELLALGKLLVSAGGCSRAVSPPWWVGGCQCLSAGPSQSVWSPFHTCIAAVLRSFFPETSQYGVGKEGRNDVVSRVLARTEVVYAFY